jgi:hypothetical protein
MTKTKLVFTTNEALAILTMLDSGGEELTTNPESVHVLPAILYSASPSPGISATKAIQFLTSLKQIICDAQKWTIKTGTIKNTHIRITIEVDPTKDFTKPTTDLSQITITE